MCVYPYLSVYVCACRGACSAHSFRHLVPCIPFFNGIAVAVVLRVFVDFVEFSSFFFFWGHIPVKAPPPPVRRSSSSGLARGSDDQDDGHDEPERGGDDQDDGHDGGGDGAVVIPSQEVHDQPEENLFEDFDDVEAEDSESVLAILEEADAAIEALNQEIDQYDNYEEWTAEEWKEWEAANRVPVMSERPVARPLAADFHFEMEAAEAVEILSDEEAEEAPKREEGSVENEEQAIREELHRLQQMLDEHLD